MSEQLDSLQFNLFSEAPPSLSLQQPDVTQGLCANSLQNLEASYQMMSTMCGYGIIIDNLNTETTRIVVKNAKYMLSTYRILVECFSNLSIKGMKQLMKAVSRVDHSNLNYLMVVILSRGEKEKGIYDTHGKCIPVEDITKHFSDAMCPSLKRKPKIFFFETILNNATLVSTCSEVHYPDTRDIYTLACTATKISFLQTVIEAFQKQPDKVLFVNIVRDIQKLLHDKHIQNIAIDVKNNLEQPLTFHKRQQVIEKREQGLVIAYELKMTLSIWSQMRTLTIKTIRTNRDKIIQVFRDTRGMKVAGSVTSVAGGVLTLFGVGLAVATGGAGIIAIPLLAGGGAIIAGGAASVGAKSLEIYKSQPKLVKVQETIEVDRQICELIKTNQEKLQKISEDIHKDHPEANNREIVAALLYGKEIRERATFDGSLEAPRRSVTFETTARIGTATALIIPGIGTMLSLTILPFDIYQLYTDTFQTETKAIQWLNEQLEKLGAQKKEIEGHLEAIRSLHTE